MAGIIGLRGPDIEKRNALRGYKVVFSDADRPIIRPHTGAPVLFLKDGKPAVERHVFGFSREFSSFNARADRLESSRMWSQMFGRSHGVAPVSYILEWADLGDGKRPYRIERADGGAMCVPALVGGYWEDRKQRAFALVTVEPNAFMSRIHDRIVAQLDDGHLDVWLRPEAHSKGELVSCLTAGPDDDLVAVPIAKDVGSAEMDDVSKLEATGKPLTWKELAKRPVVKRPEAPKGKRKPPAAVKGKPAKQGRL